MPQPEDVLTPETIVFTSHQLTTLLLCALTVPPDGVLLRFEEQVITASDLLRVVELVALGLGVEMTLPSAHLEILRRSYKAMVENTRKSLQKSVSPLN